MTIPTVTPDPAEKELDVEELRRLAEAATPGPWHADKYNVYIWGPNGEMVADSGGAAGLEPNAIIRARGTGGGLPIAANMAHVAAWNPQTALRILSDRAQLVAERDVAKKRLGYEQSALNDCEALLKAAEAEVGRLVAERDEADEVVMLAQDFKREYQRGTHMSSEEEARLRLFSSLDERYMTTRYEDLRIRALTAEAEAARLKGEVAMVRKAGRKVVELVDRLGAHVSISDAARVLAATFPETVETT